MLLRLVPPLDFLDPPPRNVIEITLRCDLPSGTVALAIVNIRPIFGTETRGHKPLKFMKRRRLNAPSRLRVCTRLFATAVPFLATGDQHASY